MTVTDTYTQPTYRQEEVQEILQLAIAQKSNQGEFTRDQLFEMAAELEIPPTTIQAAEKAWLDQQQEAQKRKAFDNYRWHQIKQKVGKYLITNSFLVTLDLLKDTTLNWSPFIFLIWGLFLSLDIWKTYHLQGEEYDRAFESWKRKYELRRSAKLLWQTFKEKLAGN
ncbi:hypothetical protein PCC7418_0380 [Halothece sp. PCC 7418]|uniref:2TM domain-containing protein n=1 Tax=Halothece sp. (strain PCC 7418) TaxID=65093 RepID=UPI0002A06E2F|nr:2TM domain-containing protein [Halothece sp. PCC 7418]AFZ42614.1 hypothetical protein PCC7418_0380 [Halothece sp. PCC 7418]